MTPKQRSSCNKANPGARTSTSRAGQQQPAKCLCKYLIDQPPVVGLVCFAPCQSPEELLRPRLGSGAFYPRCGTVVCPGVPLRPAASGTYRSHDLGHRPEPPLDRAQSARRVVRQMTLAGAWILWACSPALNSAVDAPRLRRRLACPKCYLPPAHQDPSSPPSSSALLSSAAPATLISRELAASASRPWFTSKPSLRPRLPSACAPSI